MFVLVWGTAQAKRGRMGHRLEITFVSRSAREASSGEGFGFVDASLAVRSMYGSSFSCLDGSLEEADKVGDERGKRIGLDSGSCLRTVETQRIQAC